MHRYVLRERARWRATTLPRGAQATAAARRQASVRLISRWDPAAACCARAIGAAVPRPAATGYRCRGSAPRPGQRTL